MNPEARYADVVKGFSGRRRVSYVDGGGGFGSRGQLKVDGRIFAMLVRGELVVKLPRDRVDELVDAGRGRRFDAGKGRPMREWFALASTSRQAWIPLAQEAFDFVREGNQ
jgi:hypothetical protein